MLGFLNDIILGHLPWWSWVVLGGAAAMAADLLIPVPKLNTLVAVIAAVGLSAVGFKASGYQEGVDHEHAIVQAQVDAEKARLAAGFQDQLTLERSRLAAATQQNLSLQKERDDAVNSIPVDANGNRAAPIVIPPDLARKLRAIGGGSQDGSP